MVRTYKTARNWLTSAHFVLDVYSGFLNPIMPFIAAKLGITMAIATIVMSVSQICASLLQPIFGFFADNFFKRGFIFWGLIFAAVFVPISAMSTNLFTLILFVILGSLGISIFHPQAMGFTVRFSENDFSKNMGLFLSMGSIGYSFGPIVSASVVQYFGLSKMPVTSVVGIILALLMFLCVPKISNIDKAGENKDFLLVFKTILSNSQIRLLIMISMMKALISTSCAILLPFLWKNTGHEPAYIGFALFLFMFMGGLGSLLSPFFEKKFGSKAMLYISMIATLPMMAVYVLTYKTYPIFALIDFVLMAFVLMLATPVTMVLAQRILPQYKSIIAGFINGFCWGMVAVIMTGVGFLAQNFGILKILFIISIVPLISSFFIKYIDVDTINEKI